MSSMQCFASSAGSLVLRYRAGMITSVSTSSPYFQDLPLCSMRYAPFRGFLAASITAVGCEFGTAGFPFGCTASEGDSVRGSPSRDTLWLRFTSLRPPPAAAPPEPFLREQRCARPRAPSERQAERVSTRKAHAAGRSGAASRRGGTVCGRTHDPMGVGLGIPIHKVGHGGISDGHG